MPKRRVFGKTLPSKNLALSVGVESETESSMAGTLNSVQSCELERLWTALLVAVEPELERVKKYCAVPALQGSKWSQGIAIIGRSPNGWVKKISKEDLDDADKRADWPEKDSERTASLPGQRQNQGRHG